MRLEARFPVRTAMLEEARNRRRVFLASRLALVTSLYEPLRSLLGWHLSEASSQAT